MENVKSTKVTEYARASLKKGPALRSLPQSPHVVQSVVHKNNK